jgi:monovalent cation:H+ antiporter, CPA1 family
MENHFVLTLVLFAGYFFLLTSFLHAVSNRYSFMPYTVLLLLAGFLSQVTALTIGYVDPLILSPDVIFYILLPLLLFESSLHIHIHQFRLQFKTISFLATFGLIVSMFIVGFGVAQLLGLPFTVALLFGALISATDPIAVISLFKTLGAPKRLGLVADGESMFNDATAVLAFRIVAALALPHSFTNPPSLFGGIENFIYVFVGSIALGSFLGYIISKWIEQVTDNRVVETTLTVALSLISFVAAEHYFHLSGVITTVMAGIIFGNLGRTKISQSVIPFVHEVWDYIAFVAVSLVFFFASFNLNAGLFFKEPVQLVIVIGIVLIARAVSVYLTVFISNRLPLFADEPNIPMSWQHILNWGGLRGVIPLVLVYTLPEDFVYKEILQAFTLSTLVFTLIINGLTIRWLLIRLGLHLPQKEESIIGDELSIFKIWKQQERLKKLSKKEFDNEMLEEFDKRFEAEEEKYRDHLLQLTEPAEFLKSLQLQSISIERAKLDELYQQGRCSETVFHEFESELDIQQDAIEYPEVYKIDPEAQLKKRVTLRKRLFRIRKATSQYPIIRTILQTSEENLVKEQYNLFRVRLFTSYAVLDYLQSVERIFRTDEERRAIDQVKNMQNMFIEHNLELVTQLEELYPEIAKTYQKKMIAYLVEEQSIPQK